MFPPLEIPPFPPLTHSDSVRVKKNFVLFLDLSLPWVFSANCFSACFLTAVLRWFLKDSFVTLGRVCKELLLTFHSDKIVLRWLSSLLLILLKFGKLSGNLAHIWNIILPKNDESWFDVFHKRVCVFFWGVGIDLASQHKITGHCLNLSSDFYISDTQLMFLVYHKQIYVFGICS